MIYIGPTLPTGTLRESQILNGTVEEIESFIKIVASGYYPCVMTLIVETGKLAEAKKDLADPHSYKHHIYNDIKSRKE